MAFTSFWLCVCRCIGRARLLAVGGKAPLDVSLCTQRIQHNLSLFLTRLLYPILHVCGCFKYVTRTRLDAIQTHGERIYIYIRWWIAISIRATVMVIGITSCDVMESRMCAWPCVSGYILGVWRLRALEEGGMHTLAEAGRYCDCKHLWIIFIIIDVWRMIHYR